MYQVVTGDLDRLVVHQVHLFPPPPWSTQQNKQVHFIIIIWYLNSTRDKSDYNGKKNGELDDGPSLSSMYYDKHVVTKPICCTLIGSKLHTREHSNCTVFLL